MSDKPVRDIVNDDSDTEERLYVSYYFNDNRMGAPSGSFEELFILNPKDDDVFIVDSNGNDTLRMNGAAITMRPGWLWRVVKTMKVAKKKPKPTV